MTDHEALEALSKKATQGVWEIAACYTGTGPDEQCHGLVEVEDFPIGIIDEEGATAESLSPNLEFIVALVNAYRTGQLIPAPSVEITERQSETLHKALLASYDSVTPPMPSVDDAALRRLETAFVVQMDAQADDTLPSSIHREQGHVWLEGWFDLPAAISAMQVKP